MSMKQKSTAQDECFWCRYRALSFYCWQKGCVVNVTRTGYLVVMRNSSLSAAWLCVLVWRKMSTRAVPRGAGSVKPSKLCLI